MSKLGRFRESELWCFGEEIPNGLGGYTIVRKEVSESSPEWSTARVWKSRILGDENHN